MRSTGIKKPRENGALFIPVYFLSRLFFLYHL